MIRRVNAGETFLESGSKVDTLASMARRARKRQDRPVQQADITGYLRRMIIRGEVGPDQRLATHASLVERFGCSPVTIQRALHRLQDEGFIYTKDRSGSFASANPPHRCRYALIQPYDPGEEQGLAWRACVIAAEEVSRRSPDRQIVVAERITGVDRPDYRRLLEDLASQCFAGLIFSTTPHNLTGSPLLGPDPVPRVAFMNAQGWKHIPAISIDWGSFIQRAVEELLRQGRKRLAIVGGYTRGEQVGGPLLDAILKQHRIHIPAYWRLALNPREPQAARGVMHLLFRGKAQDTPDGLILLDDHLVQVAMDGMGDAGIKPAKQVGIVAVANFPLVPQQADPVRRLGWSGFTLLETAIDLIERKRRGEAVASVTKIGALFKEEQAGEATPDA